MKIYNKIFMIIILLGIVVSCSDDYLVEEPPHLMSADQLYVNIDGFEAGLNGLYTQFRMERGGRNFGSANDLLIMPAISGTDNCYGNHPTGPARIFNDWTTSNVPTSSMYSSFFGWLYATINSANTIIARAENPDIEWTEEEKNRIIAEARHFRAWAYRHATYMWGDVPLSLEESSGDNIITDWDRTTIAEVRAQMEADWLFAEQHLPETSDNNGKVIKGVAQHYLAELYLAMGDHASAKTKAQAAVDNTNYALITDRYGVSENQPGSAFMDMFKDGNSNRSEGNTEALWVMQHGFETVGGGDNIMRRYFMGKNYSNFKPGGKKNSVVFSVEGGGRGRGQLGPTRYAMELYEDGDDRGDFHAWWTFAVLNNPDALPSGMAVGDTVWFDWEGKDEKYRNYYWPSTRKWDWANPSDLAGARQYNDQVYLRLAETYLVLAEAQFLGGDAGAAAITINELRDRANATPIVAGDVSLDFILDERSRELYSEEHRRYTLVRMGKWFERTQLYNALAGSEITERDKLFPIPQSVIDANLTKVMTQNPGY